MKIFLQILKAVLIIITLTFFTQIGGIIYLVYKPIGLNVKKKVKHKWKNFSIRVSIFSCLFLASSFAITPVIAKFFGRVPLPIFSNENYPIRPANILTCIGNRHYVKPELLELIKDVSQKINISTDEITEILYLDACFPFIDGFPILPHKSHNDGEKLDICFLFRDKENGKRINKSMSFLGYGACVGPKKGETDMPNKCAKKGYYQYSLLKKITSQKNIEKYDFDKKTNKNLLKILAKEKRIGKIFIEPHLKERLGLSEYRKIRFHGCAAVRHDDHIHIQL